MKYLALFLFFCSFTINSPAQIGGIVNTYTEVLAYDPCNNTLLVNDATGYHIGDTVLLIQMKGAVIDSTNSAAFGTILNYRNAGNYEINYISEKNGNQLSLRNEITRSYDIPHGKVQLVRIPWYQSVTVTSPLTALPWDGSKGGILAIKVQGTLTLSADIDVSGKGFRGGTAKNTSRLVTNCYTNNYYYPASSTIAAEKGESIAMVGSNRSRGKGPLAAGGGGGLDHNSGGGGGGNASPGGMGGYQLYECNNTFFDNRGIGGIALVYNNVINRIYFGSGGGAGHCNNGTTNPAEKTDFHGGNGGGIILITANSLESNGHSIYARGDTAHELRIQAANGHDGIGGGGAGGTVLLAINNYVDHAAINVIGGKGGDMYADLTGGHIGPGGGGAGGVIWFSQPAQPASVTIQHAGGKGGVLIQDNNNVYGTTPGSAGVALFDLTIPVDTDLFKKNIDSVRIGIDSISCTLFGFHGIEYTNTSSITAWNWTFGDGHTANAQDITHDFATGNYTVKLVATDINGCKDSAMANINVAGINYDFGYAQDECDPLRVQFTGLGSPLANAWWSLGDGATVSNNTAPLHTYAGYGDYELKFRIDNGCIDTIAKTISLQLLKNNIILTNDTTICHGNAKQLLAVPAVSYCWTPTTYLNNPAIANPVTTTPENITYYLTSQVPGNNLVVNGDFSAGNTGFASAYNFVSTNISEGQYFVGTNPQAWNPSLSACTDHTSGTGAMVLVNGSPAPGVEVWTQTISVTPHTNYAFAAWIQALFAPNPAQLQFAINGNTIGNLITPDLPTCTWTQFYTTWNSGDNSTAVISIVNKNTQVQGNDFALDDISFAPLLVKQDSVVITVEKPLVTTNNDTVVCNGLTVQLSSTGADTWSWQPATGLSDANIANPVATPSGSTEYIVTGTTVNGCIATDTVTIGTFPLPVVTKTSDTVICANTPAPLFASGGVTYSWTPAATLNDASLPNPVATPDTNTTYNVQITDEYACAYTDSVKVDIYPRPAFTASGDAAICEGSSATLHATGGDQYSWSPVASLDDPLSPNPVALPAASTTFTVHISENVCNYDTSFDLTITVNPNPVVQAQKSNDINCRLLTAQLIATGADSYAWSPATGVDYANQHNPVAAIDTTTTFTVTGANQFGCTGEASVEIKVTKEDIPIYALPNAFTPNGDGRNDCFGIRKWGHVTLLEFSIYNRWGHRIFSTNNPSRCWDGTFNGKYQDTGGYAFVIRARTFCGEIRRTGMVMLIR